MTLFFRALYLAALLKCDCAGHVRRMPNKVWANVLVTRNSKEGCGTLKLESGAV